MNLQNNKWNEWLNLIIGISIGALAGYSLYQYRHWTQYPELYAGQSAPWYAGIRTAAGLVAAVLAVCLLLKLRLRKR